MSALKKVLLVFSGCVILIGLIAFYRAHQARAVLTPTMARTAVVRCIPLETRTHVVTEEFYGRLEANVRVDLAFQVRGRISQLGSTVARSLATNDWVEKGQIIAAVEPDRYQAALDHADAEGEMAKAELARAEAGIAYAHAKLDVARQDLDHKRDMHKRGAANRHELTDAELASHSAEAALRSAKAQLEAASASYNASRSTLQIARVNLTDATIRAPSDALVARVHAEIGQTVQPGEPVITLVDLSRIKLVIGVVERKIPLIKRGQKVRVDVLALQSHARMLSDLKDLSGAQKGEVKVVPPAADPEDGLFKVEIELDNADRLLRPGMIARAAVTVLEKTGLAIPAHAAVAVRDKASAFFVTDLHVPDEARSDVPATVARRIEFEPLSVDRDFLLITDLPEGMDRLIVEGHSRLSDGQRVLVLDGPLDTDAGSEPGEPGEQTRP